MLYSTVPRLRCYVSVVVTSLFMVMVMVMAIAMMVKIVPMIIIVAGAEKGQG